MQTLKSQNAKLTIVIQEYLEEIEKQKEINSQHENQIETLLIFNQRLLSIIESEISEKKKESCSLQPISERSERSSDLFGQCTIESLIRSKKLVAKSEWGRPTKSLIDRQFFKKVKGNLFDHVSDVDSIKNQKQSETAVNEQDIQAELKKSSSTRIEFRSEVQKGLEQLREFKDKTNIFYDRKLTQIKSLSTRLNSYNPIKEISRISSKFAVSNETLDLINKRISKKA